MDRVHRIGQTRPVIGYRLCLADSIESRMRTIAQHKALLGDAVIHRKRFKTESLLSIEQEEIEEIDWSQELNKRPKKSTEERNKDLIGISELDREMLEIVLDRSEEAFKNPKQIGNKIELETMFVK
jgi:hypothetical protein